MLQMVESATCNYKYFELKTLTLCGKKHSEGVFMMRKISKYLFFWALGGALYYTFEILFRGFSHWSMYVLGGICVVFFRERAWDGRNLSGNRRFAVPYL